MPASSKRPTLRDVARTAGVSSQTVSRVINNNAHVSEETRKRIFDVMDELNFRPNKAAQMLATQRSHMLEVITMDIEYSGPFKRVVGAAARSLGYHAIFSEVTRDEFRASLQSAAARLVDGLVLIPAVLEIGMTDQELIRASHNVPFVQVATRVGARVPSVVYDQEHGARLATQHLIDLGHRDIAAITGPLRIYDAYARHQTWLSTLEANGITPQYWVSGDFTPKGGYEAALQLIKRQAKFTALFVANDYMALGALHALLEHGLRIPDDISVVGFDNLAEAAYYSPPLTTVYQNFSFLGETVVNYLVSLIEKPETPQAQTVLTPELIIRQSTRDLRNGLVKE